MVPALPLSQFIPIYEEYSADQYAYVNEEMQLQFGFNLLLKELILRKVNQYAKH